MRLEGSVALVTGSSKGIGRAIALTLAQQGVRVVLSYQIGSRTRSKRALHLSVLALIFCW